MLRISNFKLPFGEDEKGLPERLAAELGCPVINVRILKKAVDARSRSRIWAVYTLEFSVADEASLLKQRFSFIEKSEPEPRIGLPSSAAFPTRPLVVGSGPAGFDSGSCGSQADCAGTRQGGARAAARRGKFLARRPSANGFQRSVRRRRRRYFFRRQTDDRHQKGYVHGRSFSRVDGCGCAGRDFVSGQAAPRHRPAGANRAEYSCRNCFSRRRIPFSKPAGRFAG